MLFMVVLKPGTVELYTSFNKLDAFFTYVDLPTTLNLGCYSVGVLNSRIDAFTTSCTAVIIKQFKSVVTIL